MSDSTTQTVLIVSKDTALVESLISKNNTGFEFLARDTIQHVIDDKSILDINSLIIYDVDGSNIRLNSSVDNILSLKQLDPSQVLMVVGEADSLSEILKSNIQPLVYRAFTKPISPNQLFLAFNSANKLHDDLVEKQSSGVDISTIGAAENRTNVASISSERKTNSAIYAAVGVLALAIVGWFLFVGNSDEIDNSNTITQNTIETELEILEPLIATSDSISRINILNQNAANAMLDERIIAPKDDNALLYYNQVLAIDAYDTTAYQGKKNIADKLRTSYHTLVENTEFDRALKVINVLKRIEPLNIQNDTLLVSLEKSIDSHVSEIQKTGTSAEIANTTAVLERIGSAFGGSKSASEALQIEKNLVGKIDSALELNVLIPPAKNNAYSFVSNALKENTISKANIEPRVLVLNEKLLILANNHLENKNLDEATKLAALIKRLNVDRKSLVALNKKISAINSANTNSSENSELVVKEEAVLAKIIPAKVINRDPPRYPSRALTRGTEGWAQISFFIDTKGQPIQITSVDSKPKGVFEKAALKAIANWRFSPARNEETGKAVLSKLITTKVQFKID